MNIVQKFLFFILLLSCFKYEARSAQDILPGMLQSTEKIVLRDQAFQQEWDALPVLPQQNGAESPFQLNPFFLSSINLNTPLPYLSLIWNNSCAFVDLFWLGLLKHSAKNDFPFVVVDILQNDRTYKSYKVSKDLFLKNAYRTRCPDSSRLAFQYGQKDLASVVKKIELKIPKDLLDCENTLKELSRSAHAPYYCYFDKLYRESVQATANFKIRKSNTNYKISESAKKSILQGQSLFEWLGPDKLSYLENFCFNAHRPDKFCQSFFQQNYFQHLAIKDTTRFLLSPECGKVNLTLAEAQSCATRLMQRPDYCFHLPNSLSSFSPRPGCDDLSNLLNLSRMSSNYRDCPGEFLDDSWLTYSRIGFYFQKIAKGKNQFKLSAELINPRQEGAEYCSVNHYQHFYEFLLQEKMLDNWETKVCLTDPGNKNGICENVFWKSPEHSFLPLKFAIQKLLSKKTGVYYKGECQFVEQSDYNPDLLKFRNGCFIVRELKNCRLYHCPLTVYLDDRDQRGFLTFYNGMKFSSLPHQETKGKTLTQLLFERLKIKEKPLRSYSEVMKFLKQYPDAILQGHGCLEDLKPTSFNRSSINQCTINTFIIDGFKDETGTISAAFIIRTSLDEIYSPNYIDWRDLNTAIKNFEVVYNQMNSSLKGLYYE